MPIITVCHLIALRFLEVTYSANKNTAKPKRLTARFALVLSPASGLAIAPIMITDIVRIAARGFRERSGRAFRTFMPVHFQTQCIPRLIGLTETYKVIIRRQIKPRRIFGGLPSEYQKKARVYYSSNPKSFPAFMLDLYSTPDCLFFRKRIFWWSWSLRSSNIRVVFIYRVSCAGHSKTVELAFMITCFHQTRVMIILHVERKCRRQSRYSEHRTLNIGNHAVLKLRPDKHSIFELSNENLATYQKSERGP